MRKQLGFGLRMWVLGAAATGLLALPAVGQSKNVVSSTTKKPGSKPTPASATQPPELSAVPNGTALNPDVDCISYHVPCEGRYTAMSALPSPS